MLVKVCGITLQHQAKALCEMGVDYVGQIFYQKSLRFSTTVIACETSKVGVFVNESAEKVMSICQKHSIEIVQLHGVETPDFCNELKSNGYKVIKAIGLTNLIPSDLNRYRDKVDFLLFDTASKQHGGTGRKFDWTVFQGEVIEIPFFLSGGISTEDVEEILHVKTLQKQLRGIDINSRFELSPGVKDLKLVNKFIQKIKQHDS